MSLTAIATTAIRRSSQVYFELTSTRETVACGYAYANPRLPSLPACNFVGEVLLDDEDAPDPVGLVEGHFAERGVRCHRWIPAEAQDPQPVADLVEPLGFERSDALTFVQRRMPPLDDSIRMLPARAMRRAVAAVVAERGAALNLAGELDGAQTERLDSPQYDAFVAMRGDEPAGMLALLQAGQIGRVCDVYVCAAHRGRGVGRAMVAYATQTAMRWALRPICAQAAEANRPARRFLERSGFDECGTIARFVRPESVEVEE